MTQNQAQQLDLCGHVQREIEPPSFAAVSAGCRPLCSSPRMAEIGAGNLEIAARLGLGLETVKAYLRSAMRKLAVHNRTAAAHPARQSGML
jgi:DNA-binding NarL/FixJ family response regulator